LLLALVGLSVAATSTARADPNAASKEVCVRSYEEAQRLRGASRLLAAKRELLTCRQTCPASLETDCAQWLEDTERRLPTIVVVARSPDGTGLEAITVSQDAELVADHLDGRAISIDPGVHLLRFSTPGGAAVVQEVTLAEGEKDRRIEVRFEPPAPPPERSVLWWPPTAALASLGVGLVGLTVGLSAGAAALGKRSSLESACDASGRCPASESGDLSGYHSLTTWSTIGYVLGAASLIGGVAIWLATPRHTGAAAATAAAWVGPTSIGVSGAF
jgi:hypothetical protein